MAGGFLRLTLLKSNNVATLRNEWKEMVVKATEIWVLTDGRAGNLTQALGLAEAIARQRRARITIKNTPLKAWAARVPPTISRLIPPALKGWPFIGLSEEAAPLGWPWPDLIVSAGRRVAPISAALKKLQGTPVVHLLDPQMPAGLFDAVVVPQHDALTGANVLNSLGALNRQTRETVAAAGRSWNCPKKDMLIPQIAVLVGGPSKSATFTEVDGTTLVLALDSLAKKFGLMITTSRRTPPRLIGELRSKLSDRAFVWTGPEDGPNPYPAILAPSVATLVTSDSVNMASEAASTGKPVHVFPITSLARKLVAFHGALEAYGASQRFVGEIRHWQYEPLAEADRIATDLIRRSVI